MAIKKRSATVVPGHPVRQRQLRIRRPLKPASGGTPAACDVRDFTHGADLNYGGVILAFSQLIAYSWLKIPAESASWMLLIAGNSPVSTSPY